MFLLPSKRFSLKLRPLYLSLIHSIFHAKCGNSALTLRKQKQRWKKLSPKQKRKQKKWWKKLSPKQKTCITFSTITLFMYIPKLIRQNLHPESCPRNIFNRSCYTQESFLGIVAKVTQSVSVLGITLVLE